MTELQKIHTIVPKRRMKYAANMAVVLPVVMMEISEANDEREKDHPIKHRNRRPGSVADHNCMPPFAPANHVTKEINVHNNTLTVKVARKYEPVFIPDAFIIAKIPELCS